MHNNLTHFVQSIFEIVFICVIITDIEALFNTTNLTFNVKKIIIIMMMYQDRYETPDTLRRRLCLTHVRKKIEGRETWMYLRFALENSVKILPLQPFDQVPDWKIWTEPHERVSTFSVSIVQIVLHFLQDVLLYSKYLSHDITGTCRAGFLFCFFFWVNDEMTSKVFEGG